jgi:hypothetical protein
MQQRGLDDLSMTARTSTKNHFDFLKENEFVGRPFFTWLVDE